MYYKEIVMFLACHVIIVGFAELQYGLISSTTIIVYLWVSYGHCGFVFIPQPHPSYLRRNVFANILFKLSVQNDSL